MERRHPVKVVLDAEKVQRGLIMRGLSITKLASKARIGVSTAARAVAGEPVCAWTAYAIARVLEEQPVANGLDDWLARSGRAFQALNRSED
jgi:hypothetical protein